MKISLLLIALILIGCDSKMNPDARLLNSSKELLLEVKRGNPTDSIRTNLAQLEPEALYSLNDDASKITFWLNIYNAYFQELGKSDSVVDLTIFKKKLIPLAGEKWSFDEIENGILRRKTEFVNDSLMVEKIDYRIHFALNCGAESCPPIATYEKEKLNEQLELATKWFINSTTEINHDQKKIKISELFDWFAEDFKKTVEISELIALYTGEEVKGYNIEYISWSWDSSFRNFKDF